jgi:hypothetical protein
MSSKTPVFAHVGAQHGGFKDWSTTLRKSKVPDSATKVAAMLVITIKSYISPAIPGELEGFDFKLRHEPKQHSTPSCFSHDGRHVPTMPYNSDMVLGVYSDIIGYLNHDYS